MDEHKRRQVVDDIIAGINFGILINEAALVKGKQCHPFEYLCSDCKQLRLSFVVTDNCNNCGSTKIIKGKIGTLKRNDDG